MSRQEQKQSAVAQFFSRIKWTYVIVSVFFLALGILMIVRPESSLTVICRGLGILAAVFGAIRMLQYFLRAPQGIGQRYDLAGGLFCLLVAALLIFRAGEVAAILSVIVGIFILIDSVFKLQIALDAHRTGVTTWGAMMLLACVSLLLGILLVFDTFKGQAVISIMMGIALIYDALVDLFTVFYVTRMVKNVRAAVHEAIDDATAIETTGEVISGDE